jgi:transposase, IS5 family
MAWKNTKQLSLADALASEHAALKVLDEVHDLIDWARIEGMLSYIHANKKGEQAWPPLLMFKAMLLQSWYSLSDPKLEASLARDIVFRRFVGLGFADSVPDHSTLWRFRNHPTMEKIQDELLQEINDQLAEKSLYVKAGEISIVDASVIQAQRNRPHKDKKGNNTQDPEAGYSVKMGSDGKQKTTYGFKAHVNVDEDGFVKAMEFTAGNVHDSQVFTELLSGDETKVFADSAYASGKTNAFLAENDIENGVLDRPYRNRKLTGEQKQRNKMLSRTRFIVERFFGIAKLHYGMSKARYLGIARNKMRVAIICMAHNIKRGVALQREIDQMQESYAY